MTDKEEISEALRTVTSNLRAYVDRDNVDLLTPRQILDIVIIALEDVARFLET